MKIALFTSNQPRHQNLIRSLAGIADDLVVVSEVTTVFPGQTEDFYHSSDVMKRYFSLMQRSEQKVFGEPGFLPKNVRLFPIKMGDVNAIPFSWLSDISEADFIIVFGASWIKGELCDFLVSKQAINIHMGVSPYYRGATCNFWALYEKRPEFVGATLHYLSKGLDSGAMIMHALPKPQLVSAFDLGMLAVKAAHDGLCQIIKDRTVFSLPVEIQDKSKQIRYSRRAEFNDHVAEDYLSNELSPEFIFEACAKRDLSLFLRPFLS